MGNANHETIRKPLSSLFVDPYLRAIFKAAENDGLAPAFVETDHPRQLDGGDIQYDSREPPVRD